jgi:hypothetical protein
MARDKALDRALEQLRKPGSTLIGNASDSTAETIADAISRNGDGSPSGVIGTVLNLIARQP